MAPLFFSSSVPKLSQCPGIPAPVFLDPHKKLQKNFGIEHVLDFFARFRTDAFELAAFFADDDAFLGTPLKVNGGLNFNQLAVFLFFK